MLSIGSLLSNSINIRCIFPYFLVVSDSDEDLEDIDQDLDL